MHDYTQKSVACVHAGNLEWPGWVLVQGVIDTIL